MYSLQRLHHGRLLPHTSAKSSGVGEGGGKRVLQREQAVVMAFHVELLATVNLAAHSALLATVNANQYPRQVPP